VGIVPLLFAVGAALSLRRRETTFWGGVALVALLVSFGGETFMYSPLYLFAPGFSIFRGQERLAFLVSLALALLAAYGFAAYGRRRSQPSDRVGSGRSRSVGWLLAGSIGLTVLFFYGLNSAGWQSDSPFYALLGRSVWLAIILALAWGLMHVGARRGRLVTAGAIALVVLDLFTAGWQTNLTAVLPEVQTEVPAPVEAIRHDAAAGEVWRAYNEYRVYENYGVPFEIEDTWGASPLRLARYDELHRVLRMERVWELLNVRYVITWRKELYAPSQIIYQEPAEKDVTYVHRLDAPAPRAWLVHDIEEVDDARALARLDEREFDPQRTALVPPGITLSIGRPATSQTGLVDIVERTQSSLSLSVVNPADGLLVLSEVHYPGWRAQLDGHDVALLRVDYVLRGVAVPAGEHRIEVVFRPATVTWGAVISVVTLGAVILIATLRRLRRR